MSGLAANCNAGGAAPACFFSLLALALATCQSATAATAMNTSAGSAACTASCISRAVRTSMRCTPRGVASKVGPATSVTDAPASTAARARANPVLPDDRLVMPRTGSIGSNVGPAVSTMRFPASRLGWKKRNDIGEQFSRLEHAAHPDLTARLVARRRPEQRDAVGG